MSGQQVLRALIRARSLTADELRTSPAEMQWRQDKLFDLNGPARTNFGRSVWSDRPRNSYSSSRSARASGARNGKAALRSRATPSTTTTGGGGESHGHCHGHGHSHHHHGSPSPRGRASWALTKVRTHEERHAVAPIDASLLGSLEASAYESFLGSLRQQTRTAYAEFVTLTYQNSTRDGETVKEPTPDVVDEVGRRVAAFLGEATMAQPPWIRQWTNKAHHGEVMTWDAYEDECIPGGAPDSEDSKGDALGDYHDADRPYLNPLAGRVSDGPLRVACGEDRARPHARPKPPRHRSQSPSRRVHALQMPGRGERQDEAPLHPLRL